jgi:hypothetical protein
MFHEPNGATGGTVALDTQAMHAALRTSIGEAQCKPPPAVSMLAGLEGVEGA